jgi:hypothetical protein
MTSVVAPGALAESSKVKGYDKKLRMRAHLKDIYVNLTGLFERETQTIPNAIYMKVNEANKGTNNVTITMKLPLVGDPVTGNDPLSGSEEIPVTKHGTIYRNNYKKAVSSEEYGVRNLDQVDYGLYKQHISDLGMWAQQYKGLRIRQAGLETYASNLWDGDTASVAAPRWNPHFFIQGATDAQQPLFDTSNSVYADNIVDAMIAAGGGSITPTNAQVMTYRFMNKLAMRALDEKIWTLDIGGNDAYILTVSALQASIFSDPTFATNTGGAVWKDITQLSEKIQNWYNVLGCFKTSIGVDIYVVIDHKCPTLQPSATAPPYSLSAGYVHPGDRDLRNRNQTNARDAGMLWGKAGLVEWEPEPLHFVKQDEDYFRVMGHGIAGVSGIQQLHFDQESPTSTSIEYYGSMVVVFARIAY